MGEMLPPYTRSNTINQKTRLPTDRVLVDLFVKLVRVPEVGKIEEDLDIFGALRWVVRAALEHGGDVLRESEDLGDDGRSPGDEH